MLIAVFFSGFTGLAYQVTWQKHLAILLGSHASATAAVLALFFLFLSLGYHFIGKYSTRILQNQILLYAIIELIIGLYALYSNVIFSGIYDLFLHSSFSAQGLLAGLPLCAAFIGLPTFLMGGTIPVLTQGLSAQFEESADVHAQVYGVNALGAVAGCLVAGFYFLENFGVTGTLIFAGNLNILVAVFAGVIAYRHKTEFSGPETASAQPEKISCVLLLISFLSGFYTFALENLVIRMAGVALGSSTYTYSVVVAAFILAIALGSLVLARNRKLLNAQAYGYILFGAFLSASVLFATVPYWPKWFHRIRILFQSSLMNFEPYQICVLIVMVLILLVPISLIGANLPMLFGLLRQRGEDLSQSVGRLYAVNSVGSVFGATLGGYWIFEVVGADTAFRLSVFAIGLATVLVAVVFFAGKIRSYSIAGIALVSVGLFLLPSWKDSSFVPGYFYQDQAPKTARSTAGLERARAARNEKVLFSHFDANTYVVVTELPSGESTLYLNGKPDSSTAADTQARSMAVITPMLLKPSKAESVFVVGLGAGLSTGLLTKFPESKSVHVAEISSGVVQALPHFLPFNYGLQDRMDKVKISVGDAYKILLDQKETYDLIISEPTSTWVSGVEKLFTTEFYQAGSDRLAEDGMYVQWFPLFAMDPSHFSRVLKSFAKVFPFVSVYRAAAGTVTFIGAKQAFSRDENLAKERFSSIPEQVLADVGVLKPDDILNRRLMGPEMVALIRDAEWIEDHSIFNTTLEYASARAFFAGISLDLNELISRLKNP